MALEDILKKISSDIDEKTKEIKESALTSARRIEDEGRKKAESLKKEILTKASEVASREKERIVVDAQIQLKKDLLSFKRQFIKDVFTKAIERIVESKNSYQQFLEKILSRFTQGDEEIILSSQDREKFSDKWLNEFNKKNNLKLKYSKEVGKISGGVIFRSNKKEINASLKTLMKELQENYEAKIAKMLFGEL